MHDAIDWSPGLFALAIASGPFLLYAFAVLLSRLDKSRIDSMADDFTALQSEVATLKTNVTSVEAEVALLKAGNPSNQPAIDAITADVKAANDALSGLLTPPPAALAVSPTTLTVTVGSAVTDQLIVSGGTAPYSFDAGGSGLSVDPSGAVTGTIAAAGDSTITVADAAGGSVSIAVTAS